MAVVGCLGEIIFSVSDRMVRTISEWKWSGSARYAVHARHGTHALTEFTGLDPDQITFEITLLAELGVRPMEELVKLWRYERNGTAVPMTIGRHAYGKYRWNIVSHETEILHTTPGGDITAARVSLTLQEYLKTG